MNARRLGLVCASCNPLLLDGLTHLEALGPYRILAQVSDVPTLLAALPDQQPALLILDLDFTALQPGLIGQCRLAHPTLKVVLLQGATLDPTLSPEVAEADLFVNGRQSMATLIQRMQTLQG